MQLTDRYYIYLVDHLGYRLFVLRCGCYGVVYACNYSGTSLLWLPRHLRALHLFYTAFTQGCVFNVYFVGDVVRWRLPVDCGLPGCCCSRLVTAFLLCYTFVSSLWLDVGCLPQHLPCWLRLALPRRRCTRCTTRL